MKHVWLVPTSVLHIGLTIKQTHIGNTGKEKMKIGEITETTSVGSVASVATPIGGLLSRQPKNADGTAKNALDQDSLMGGKKKKSTKKKA